MSETMIVVVLVLVAFSILGFYAHKAEKIIRTQKAEERKLAEETAGKNKK